MKIFKAKCSGDTMYIRAETQDEAEGILFLMTGPIPSSLTSWEVVPEVPEGEALLNG